MKWEHAILRWHGDGRFDHRSITYSDRGKVEDLNGQLDQVLKMLGDEGWEMVGLSCYSNSMSTPAVYAFKRPAGIQL
ncbi:MAG: hypothetical protein ACYC4L_21385 [Chloroflexota bacterium]